MLKSHLSQLYQISDAQQKQAQKSVEASFQEPKFDAIAEDDETEAADPQDPISSMCQQLSQELSALSNKEEKGDAEENVAEKKVITCHIPYSSILVFSITIYTLLVYTCTPTVRRLIRSTSRTFPLAPGCTVRFIIA